MAGSVTDAVELDLLKLLTGQATSVFTTTPPTNVYCALCTSTPSDSAAGTEVSGGSYARVQTVGKWAAPSAGSVASNADVDFGTATGSWGTVTHFELWSASSAGTRYAWGSLTASKTIASGDSAKFASGSLTIAAD